MSISRTLSLIAPICALPEQQLAAVHFLVRVPVLPSSLGILVILDHLF